MRIKKYRVSLNGFDFFDDQDLNAASNIVPIDNFNKIETRNIPSFTGNRYISILGFK
ncbi:MAG TPA: hypothetical protein VIJ75_04055 [Hanamia sp.]